MTVSKRRALLCAASASAMLAGSAALAEEHVDYVRVCDPVEGGGSGFFYIPGTDTCLKVAGYVRAFVYTPGSDLSMSALAYEPVQGVLVNPMDTVDMELEGRGVAFGFRGMLGGPLSRWGFRTELHFNELEGRGVSGGFVPNVGIPGVGQDFGKFQGSPTDFVSGASTHMQQWGARLEKNYRLFDNRPVDPSQWGYQVKALGGLHYTDTDSDFSYGAQLWNAFGWTDVNYSTDLDERTLTPYVGLSAGFRRQYDGYNLSFGIAGRLGASFTSYDGRDSLRSESDTDFYDMSQSTDISESVTNPYFSLNGSVGIGRGPATLSLTAAAEYGAYRDPNIFRADSVEVSPNNFETVPTTIDPEAFWTYNVGVKFTYRFGAGPSPYRVQRAF